VNSNQLKIFLSVAQTLNLTRASAELYITQPAVSYQLTELERELGARLFVRTSHNVELTTAGRSFLVRAREMIATESIAKSEVSDIANGNTGHLHILATQSAIEPLTSLLRIFSKEYPNIRVEHDIVTGSRMISSINEGNGDVFFSFESLLEEHAQLDRRILTKEHYRLMFANDYNLDVDINDLSSLEELPLVSEMSTEAPLLVKKIFKILEHRNFKPKKIHWCNSAIAMQIAVRAGLGFTVYPTSDSESGLSSSLRIIELEGDDASSDTSIGWCKDNTNEAVVIFMNTCKKHYL
jgi:DNA-binding transcriptional LysR family regulator